MKSYIDNNIFGGKNNNTSMSKYLMIDVILCDITCLVYLFTLQYSMWFRTVYWLLNH